MTHSFPTRRSSDLPVRYVAADGSVRLHTFDFLVLGKNGQRVAIAVKPENMVESSGILETLACIEQRMPKRFAHAIRLCTRKQISSDRAKDARTILRYRSTRNENDIAAVLQLMNSLGGAVRIDELIDKSGIGAHRSEEHTSELQSLMRISTAGIYLKKK